MIALVLVEAPSEPDLDSCVITHTFHSSIAIPLLLYKAPLSLTFERFLAYRVSRKKGLINLIGLSQILFLALNPFIYSLGLSSLPLALIA